MCAILTDWWDRGVHCLLNLGELPGTLYLVGMRLTPSYSAQNVSYDVWMVPYNPMHWLGEGPKGGGSFCRSQLGLMPGAVLFCHFQWDSFT